MSKVLIIGAGSAGSVVVKKCCQLSSIFTDIHLASRTLSKCEALQSQVSQSITIHQVDADDADQVYVLLKHIQPELVINMALPYQDPPIMDACLNHGVAIYFQKIMFTVSYHITRYGYILSWIANCFKWGTSRYFSV